MLMMMSDDKLMITIDRYSEDEDTQERNRRTSYDSTNKLPETDRCTKDCSMKLIPTLLLRSMKVPNYELGFKILLTVS
jgi:hypothetical protein